MVTISVKNQSHLTNKPVPTYPRGVTLSRPCRIPRGRATSLRVSHEAQKITIVLYSATNSGIPTFHTCEPMVSKGMLLNGKSRSSISHIVMANMYMSDLVCGHDASKGKGVRNSILYMHVNKEHLQGIMWTCSNDYHESHRVDVIFDAFRCHPA